MAIETEPEIVSNRECMYLLAEVKQKPHIIPRLQGLLKRSSKNVKSRIFGINKTQKNHHSFSTNIPTSDTPISIQHITAGNYHQGHKREYKESSQERVSETSSTAFGKYFKRSGHNAPHEPSYDFKRLLVLDKSNYERNYAVSARNTSANIQQTNLNLQIEKLEKEESKCSQGKEGRVGENKNIFDFRTIDERRLDSCIPTKNYDKKSPCCLNSQLQHCGNGELHEITSHLERMLLGSESKSIGESEDISSCSSSHAFSADNINRTHISNHDIVSSWCDSPSFEPWPSLKTEDRCGENCLISRLEGKIEDASQNCHVKEKSVIVEFATDYGMTMNSNITTGSFESQLKQSTNCEMDVESFEHERLLLTHETRSTDESDEASDKKNSFSNKKVVVSDQPERFLLSHEPRSKDNSDETTLKKHSFFTRKVEASIQQSGNRETEKQPSSSSSINVLNLDNDKEPNYSQLSDLSLSSSIVTYRDDTNSRELNSCCDSKEDLSDHFLPKESTDTRHGTENALSSNSRFSDLSQSCSFQGEQRQEDDHELILMMYLPSLSTWSGEGADLKSLGVNPKGQKSRGGGRFRRSVRNLAAQTSSFMRQKP